MNLFHEVLLNLEKNEQQFVVIGAMDGIAHDELYPYAFKNKHWKGLLVEPVKSYFEELKNNYENRDNLIFENVAITEKEEEKEIFTVERSFIKEGKVPFWCNGISTFKENSPTISRNDIKDKVKKEKVKCCTFEHLVQKHNIQNIDILQIDAEGCDYFIFQQIWNKGFKPKFIHIEIVHMNQNEKENIYSLLQNNGYKIEICGDNLTATKMKA